MNIIKELRSKAYAVIKSQQEFGLEVETYETDLSTGFVYIAFNDGTEITVGRRDEETVQDVKTLKR